MEPSAELLLSFAVFLVLFLGIGVFAVQRSAGSEADYLLGGRTFGRWMVGLSAGATGNTTFVVIAVVGVGYTQGFGVVPMIVGFALGELVFWTFFSGPVAAATEETRAETVAELVTSRLPGPSAQRVRSVVSLLIFVFVGGYLAAQLAGAATILNVFFGVSAFAGVLVALGSILAYCTTGGLRASIWTDFAQAIVMLIMTIGVVLVALSDVGGISGLMTGLSRVDPNLLSPMSGHTPLGFVGEIVGFAAIGAVFGLSQPHVTVRLMAARNVEEAKQARWIYMGFVYATFSAMALFGICCRLLLAGIADPEQSLPTYAISRFDPWIVGIVLAGIFSTIASSADSQILACSSAISRDFSPRLDVAMTRRLGVGYQRGATVLTGVVAALVAIALPATVFDLVVFSLSVLAASVGAGMLVTIFKLPTSPLAMGLSIPAGCGVALVWRYLGYHDVLSDAVPGLLAALAVHEAVVRLRPVTA